MLPGRRSRGTDVGSLPESQASGDGVWRRARLFGGEEDDGWVEVG